MHSRLFHSLVPVAGLLVLLHATCPALAVDEDVVDPYSEYRDEVSRGVFSYDDSQDIPWMESETEVLALPRDDDLVQVDIDQLPPGLALWVDETRITVDPKDRIVRLWLWLRSEQGTENGTFEGYRCETGEYKVYAYANPRRDPPVTKANRPAWQAIPARRRDNYRRELLRDYFCGIRGVRDAAEIREGLTGEFRRETFLSN